MLEDSLAYPCSNRRNFVLQRRNNPDLSNMEAAPRRDRHRLISGLLACGLTVLAGCSVAPLPELKPSVPDTWRNAPAGVAPPSADLKGWWQALGDPELDALINRALQNNLDVA